MLHPRYKKTRLPKGGFGLEKVNKEDIKQSQLIVKFENGSEIHGIDCDDSIRGQSSNNIWMNQEIQCHSCCNKDVCKYHGDYLEQIVHIIDVYDGVFDLNCNHYKPVMKRIIQKLDIE